MTALSIQSDPDFPTGGHAIIQAPFGGKLPAGDLELKIQHIQRKEWLTTKGWIKTDGSIIVPAANVHLANGTLRIKVGREIVDQFGYRDGLVVALPALGVEGRVRLPESVRVSNSEFGAGHEIGAQTTRTKGPGVDLIRKDVVGEEPDQNKPAEFVGAPPPPVATQPPLVVEPTPAVLVPPSELPGASASKQVRGSIFYDRIPAPPATAMPAPFRRSGPDEKLTTGPPPHLSDAAMAAQHVGRPDARQRAEAADVVDVTVFAPVVAPRSTKVMVQVMLHPTGNREVAAALATLIDSAAAMRGSSALEVDVRIGTKITLMLCEPALAIDVPIHTVTWRGKVCAANFLVTLPDCDDVDLFPKVIASIDGAPVGEVLFKLSVRRGASGRPVNVATEPMAVRRYRRVFFSYSSKDRKKVLSVAQSYRAAGVDFFQDILSLDPGARWEKGLYSEIDKCDLFLLFWSKAARKSEWVTKETRYVLARINREGGASVALVPLILEGPPAPKPHDFLRHLHFDDWMRYASNAIETKSRKRWWPF